MIRSLRHILTVLVVAGAFGAAAGVASAANKGTTAASKDTTACWKTLINDWYDGRIDGTYPIHCYRDALEHLPSDVDTYSSARDDIQQALQKRITQSRRNRNGQTTTPTTAPGGGSNGGGPKGGGSDPNGNGGGNNSQASGPFNDAINKTKPGSADSLPVPLLVLGGVALLLMAAGAAGFLARRSRLRRVQMASATSVPHGPGPESPEQR